MTRVYSVSNGTHRRFFVTIQDARRRAAQVAAITRLPVAVEVRIHRVRSELTRHELVERLHGKKAYYKNGRECPDPAVDEGATLASYPGTLTGALSIRSPAASMLPLLTMEGFKP